MDDLEKGRRMSDTTLTRRSLLVRGGAGAAAVLGGARLLSQVTPAWGAATGQIYQTAASKGIIYGSSTATWQY
jgi:hypothetical protein